MSNMSYCRWRNTLTDLRDCFEHIADPEELSEDEASARVELVALCKQFLEWEPDDPIEEEDKTEVLLDGAHGRYIPMKFAHEFYMVDPRWIGVDPDDLDVVANGPDTEGYEEAWESILNHARYMDKDGREWKLWLDGDLFAYTGDGEQWV